MENKGILGKLIKSRVSFTVISRPLHFCGEHGAEWILIVHERNGELIKAKEAYKHFAIRDLTKEEVIQLRELRGIGIIKTIKEDRIAEDGDPQPAHIHNSTVSPNIYPNEKYKSANQGLEAKAKVTS